MKTDGYQGKKPYLKWMRTVVSRKYDEPNELIVTFADEIFLRVLEIILGMKII